MERIADSRPDDNQIEVSVFGPGYGESIVIHAGNGEWIIVDSCINPISGKPAPLEYLERIGVDPALSVRLIVATHWHDDHIRGLSRPKPVEEMLKGAVRSIRPLHSSFGHVRVRSSGQMDLSELAVDLFGDAIPLVAFHSS